MPFGAIEVEHPRGSTRRASLRRAAPVIALGTAVVFVGLTFLAVNPVANAAFYAVVQVLLVAVATIDLATRRIPNVLVVALAAVALVPRVAAERSVLVESAVVGIAVFAVALLFAILARGGLGMGDVKLAGALGLVLGKVALLALLIGTLGGAVAAIVILIRRGAAGRRTTIAYGPYLALGGMLAVLLFAPPPLV
jgi:leader peptidase (prepilin peptidase)/N-methyltransferase